MSERKLRATENKATQYTPNAKCEEFIKMVGRDKTFVNLFVAGNGVGKTAVGANMVANICWGAQNEWFANLPLFDNFPYFKIGRIISDPTTIKQKIVPELKKWFPSNRYNMHYGTKKEGKAYESRWTTDTGFSFDIMSTEQEAKEFESTDLGWCWIDEPCPQAIYNATIARGRMGMILFWSMTPLMFSAWIDDRIVSKVDGVNQDVVEADVEDNCETHGIRGILKHENIERMIAQWPEDEIQARAHGKFGHTLGRVHKRFRRDIHWLNPFKVNYEDFCVYEALDTHPRVNDAVLWLAVDRQNQYYLIDELWVKMTTPALANAIKAKCAGWRIINRVIDPSAWNKDDRKVNDVCIADELKDLDLVYKPGAKDIVGGIRLTDDALSFTQENGILLRRPQLSVFNHLDKTTYEFEKGYQWDEYTGKGADMKDPKPKPRDKDDHFMENLHRLLTLRPTFEPLSDEERRIIERERPLARLLNPEGAVEDLTFV